jgi:hypothetical protein
MHKIKFIAILFFILGGSGVLAQQKYTISGIVNEASSNESLIGANVVLIELNTGASTNEYGFYSITLSAGEYTLHISSIGFQDITQKIILDKNLKRDFNLHETVEELEEIVVTSDIEQINISSPQMSVNRLTLKTIKSIPVVFGEADVIKSILLLPGVTSAGEASTGFNVRGGAVGQNLILIDEATVFNSSHLFGLFSVFNPDAIKSVKLYKGGIPSRYGGRVSSVLDIFQKEGNSKKFKINGGIGTMAGRLLVEGPIVKDRTAFLFGGRVSYGHFLLPLLDNVNSAYFYDLNAKLNHKINEKSNIFLSSYFGRDRFSIHESFVNTFGNAVVNFRWNNFISEKLFSNLSLVYSNYHNGLELDFQGFKWTSNIVSYSFKYDFNNYLNDKLQVNYGVSNIYYQFNPGTIEPLTQESDVLEEQLIKKYANELAIYLDLVHDITKRISLQYGVRLSHFTRMDQESINVYKNKDPLFFDPFLLIYQGAEPIDTKPPSGNGYINMFVNLEPRLSVAYNFNSNTSIKASYNRMAQYLHLLSNTNSPTSLDVWTPSGPFVKPQLLNQYALGFYKNFKNSSYSIETEIFYKDIENRIDYIDGADLIANNAIEQVILSGEARAYGAELLFRKNNGKLKGWLAYTLSKSEQRTPGRIPKFDNGRSNRETGINFEQWYNTPYDKTHDFALYGSYELNKKWQFNLDFVYQTGQPTNYPIGQFEFQGLTIPYYGLRNVERLPDYHRLDISVTLIPFAKASRKWYSEWIFSVYNVYNRKNAASINFRNNPETGENEAVRTSIFGIVPAITYNFKF